jgi:thymidylate kinase
MTVRGIVVEGADGAGKSELVRKLRNEYYWPVIHVVQPGTPNIEQMLKLLDVGPVIFDRFHLSPVVYGQVLRTGPELDWHDVWALEGILTARAMVLVICKTDDETMTENNIAKPQLWEETKKLSCVRALNKGYVKAMSDSSMFSVIYDYKEATPVLLREWCDLTPLEPAPRGVLGNGRPERWLVGDRRGPGAPGGAFRDIPFYLPGVGHQWRSHTVLARAMIELGWDWRTTALSNSIRGFHHVDLATEYEELGRPRTVIALGAEADSRLEKANIEHSRAPHPQWWRRFRRATGVEGYMETLTQAETVV